MSLIMGQDARFHAKFYLKLFLSMENACAWYSDVIIALYQTSISDT